MGSARPGRVNTTISVMPARGGLATAGHQVTIPETSFWRMENVTTLLDGLIAKRPGLRQWGQTIKVPDPDATDSTITRFVDFLNGTAGFIEADATSGAVTTTVTGGMLQTNVTEQASTNVYTLNHSIPIVSTNSEWSIRFMVKGTNLPEYTAAATDPNTFAFRVQGALNTGKEFALYAGGLYYKAAVDDTYVLVSGTELAGQGGWGSIEIHSDTTGDTIVYYKDMLVDTITSTDMKVVSLTETATMEFQWMPEGTVGGTPGTQYTTFLSTPMYNDIATDPFLGKEVVAIKSFQYKTRAGSKNRALLCAAGRYVYHDNEMAQAWRPLHAKQYQNVFFCIYENNVIWSDNDGNRQASLWKWNGYKDPELLDDAPPLQFMWEHQQRLFGAGDPDNPFRVYYSKINDPNVWYSPSKTNIEDEFDVILNAGFITIPGKKGDQVTAGTGDYYGVSVAWTRTGVWGIEGSGPTSYRRDAINQDVGCESPDAVTEVGNDIWFVGRQGVHTLATTQKFGNIQTNYPSGPIQNLWNRNPSSVLTISREYLANSKIAYNPHQGLIYVAVPLTGDVAAQHIYVYNVNAGIWRGPWTIDNRAMANVEVSNPVSELVMHGDVEGRVGYTDESYKADFTDGSVDMLIETAYIDGRSIHPLLPGLTKTFKKLRLFILPRGNWDFTVKWKVFGKKAQGPVTKNQVPHSLEATTFFLTNDFRLTLDPDGILRSREEMGIIEIPLDDRGLAIAFVIEQSGIGEDLVIQGFEVECTSDGYEQE